MVAGGEQISSEANAKEKLEDVANVVHKVTHYGALGEGFLGYEEQGKALKKAVKEKEKAAKKARKAKKKKTGKKEDLFDPENLAKFKAELEERKKREAEFADAQQEADEDTDADSEEKPQPVPEAEKDIKFTLEFGETPPLETSSKNQSALPTPLRLKSPLTPVKTHTTDDWKFFESLTAGVDAVIKKKKEELDEIKVDSYFQKKAETVSTEDSAPAEGEDRKKKKWVDLDKAGFDDIDGSVSGTDDEEDVD